MSFRVLCLWVCIGGPRLQIRDRDLERGANRHRRTDDGIGSGLHGIDSPLPVRAEAVRRAGERNNSHQKLYEIYTMLQFL